MTSIVLCPNCGGQKTVSKPPYIAGDVNAWADSGTPTYPCPTCDGRGWIRADSTSQDDFDTVKFVALSSMETAENLMDECTKRADRIKELEAELGSMVAVNHAAEREIERLRTKISDIEGQEDLVTTELGHRVGVAERQLHVMKEMRDEVLEDWEKKRGDVARLQTVVHELEADEVCLNSSIKAFRAVIGEKDLRIADMESQREMVHKVHDAREEELLGIINDLTNENRGLQFTMDNWKASHCYDDATNLEVLYKIMEIVNKS
jgi:chromosome segregation ATPase